MSHFDSGFSTTAPCLCPYNLFHDCGDGAGDAGKGFRGHNIWARAEESIGVCHAEWPLQGDAKDTEVWNDYLELFGW